ncbi:MAG: bifunctional oligoribonuclease/PAP phosphatase NrnA [Candidatus Andersenbacteria bacterium]
MPKSLNKNWLKLKKTKKSSLLAEHSAAVQAIDDAVRSASTIMVAAHARPDGDALGSVLSLYHCLRELGKDVTVYIPDPAPDFFAFLPGLTAITHTKPDTSAFDLLIITDCTSAARANLTEEIAAHPNSINIDHHHGNAQEGTINVVVPEAAATTYILFELFQSLNWPITKDVATSLLTGIFTDTGSFMHDSVTPELLEIAAILMNKGARLSHIAHETYQKKELPGLKIWGRVLSGITIDSKIGAAVSIVTQQDLEECKATLDDLEGVVSMINTLPDTKFAMLLVQMEPGMIKGSLRSEPHKGVDVSKLAKKLGGGGHKLASGFEIEGDIVRQSDTWRVVPPTHTT